MSPVWVFLVYATSVGLALALLYFMGGKAWYWHAASIALALAIGMIPMPWNTPQMGLAIGFVFVFLLFWGIGGALFRTPHHWRHA